MTDYEFEGLVNQYSAKKLQDGLIGKIIGTIGRDKIYGKVVEIL